MWILFLTKAEIFNKGFTVQNELKTALIYIIIKDKNGKESTKRNVWQPTTHMK